jgi:DNA-binding NtrC family response regulator
MAGSPKIESAARGNLRVLIAGPDDVRPGLAASLSLRGYEIWTASDAPGVISWLQWSREFGLAAPDVVVLDARALHGSAVSLLTELRRAAGQLPIALVAVNVDGEAIEPDLEREAAALLEKPFPEDALNEALLLVHTRRLNEPSPPAADVTASITTRRPAPGTADRCSRGPAS